MIDILKKITLSVLFVMFSLFYTAFAQGQALTVMSFNLNGKYKESTDYIAEIIERSNADLVLLQEVNIIDETQFPDELKRKVNIFTRKKWDYRTTFQYASCARNEHNMVLFNQEVIKCIDDMGAKESFRNKYKFVHNKTQTLKMKYNNKEFILVNVHFAHNSKDNENGFTDDTGNLLINCRADLQEAGNLFANFKRKIPILVGGDFNWWRKELSINSGFASSKYCPTTIDGTEGIFEDPASGMKTTLSKSGNIITTSNDYDHFIVSKMEVIEDMSLFLLNNGKGPIKLNKKTFYSSQDFRGIISDHLPIKITVKF